MARVGGLGAVLGDPGSGYDLGRAALRAVGPAVEGRGSRSALADTLLHRLHLGGLDELVRWAATADVPTVAALAADVLAAAADGDGVANSIADAGADELARHVGALAERFGRDAPVQVALGGGLLTRSEEYRRRVVARIVAEVPAADVKTAPVDAVLGAVQMARRLAG
jgi:N-acetylglucosamine kinase